MLGRRPGPQRKEQSATIATIICLQGQPLPAWWHLLASFLPWKISDVSFVEYPQNSGASG